jgi:hypothetical protein
VLENSLFLLAFHVGVLLLIMSKSVLRRKFERLEDNKDRLYLMSVYNYDSENNSMGLYFVNCYILLLIECSYYSPSHVFYRYMHYISKPQETQPDRKPLVMHAIHYIATLLYEMK